LVGTSIVPIFWAQTAPGQAAAAAILALRRWCASLTLSSPDPVPRPSFGLETWFLGMAALLLVVMVVQGPLRALRQVFDIPGHVRLAAAALRRLRGAGRLVAITCGVTVVVWTANQTVSYNLPQGIEDLEVVLRTKSVAEASVEQGILAGLTPMRDLFGMGDMLPLLVVAAALVFRVSADRWGGLLGPSLDAPPSASGWTTLYWGSAWLYALYRFAAMVEQGDLPLGGCLFPEAALVPFLMVLADGLLLAWILVELRNTTVGGAGSDQLDINGTIALVPAAALACLAALPARYLGTGILLALPYVPGYANGIPLSAYRRLAWGLVGMQGAALMTVGIAGAAAWSRGTLGGAIRGYVRLLWAEGGHLVSAIALGGLAAGSASALAYALVLSLPRQPWVLTAADSYAHYATLPIGLLTLAALVELGERSLPLARVANSGEPDSAGP
jgi:hypothetical protein